MRILLTGATGFLGKNLLSRLVTDQRVEQVVLLSRRKLTHPHPKVSFIQLDLADPNQMQNLKFEGDAVIHLAGLYDFSKSSSENYSQNVVLTLNLISLVEKWNETRRVPIYYASTYSVGLGRSCVLDESPLDQLPSKESLYAFSKAVAEKLITDSALPSFIFRLGILVGSEVDGDIEKIDGPYEFMKQLHYVSKLPGSSLLRRVPIPCNIEGLLPLVPVNQAASVFHEALFHPELQKARQKVFGVYRTESLKLSDFCEMAVPRFLKRAKPWFIDKLPQMEMPVLSLPVTNLMHDQFLKAGWVQKNFEIFRFSLKPIVLSNDSFVETFGKDAISHFSEYQEKFFSGFHQYMKDMNHE